jgi:DNA-binding NarL/FixJ family response regulator
LRILIVDNHWVTRLGLTQFLAALDPDTEVVEASTLDEGARLIGGRKRFDLCLLDFQLEGMDPISALRQLHQAAPKVRILIVTAVASRRLALDAVEEGASGYVLKSSTPEELTRALQRVCEGDIWLPAGLRDMPAGPAMGPAEEGAALPFLSPNPSLSVLTPRQHQVLELVAMGKRNVDIAETLGISPRTVQIHVSTILKLLKVSNRTEAALLAHGREPGT